MKFEFYRIEVKLHAYGLVNRVAGWSQVMYQNFYHDIVWGLTLTQKFKITALMKMRI